MNSQAPSLAELAGRFGIATEYQDWSGRRIEVPESTLVAVLAAFGVAAATESERTAAQTAHDRRYWSRALPPTILGRPGAPTMFWVHVTHGQPAEVWLRLEDGTEIQRDLTFKFQREQDSWRMDVPVSVVNRYAARLYGVRGSK